MSLENQMKLAKNIGDKLKEHEIDATVNIYREEVC